MHQPTLYLLLGYPGAGKTTTAKTIHDLTGAVHLWADQERRKQFGIPRHTPSENNHLYTQLNHQAANLLAQGKSVVYDTGFNFYKDRQHLRDIAAAHNAKCILLWVQTNKEVARIRATKDAHQQTTRVLGNMDEADFMRLSGNLEEPQADEPYVAIDGTAITPTYIADKLSLA